MIKDYVWPQSNDKAMHLEAGRGGLPLGAPGLLAWASFFFFEDF